MFLKKKHIEREFRSIDQKIDSFKMLQGGILARLNITNTQQIIQDIHLAEFKVFSQWGDDGIIQFLVDYLGIEQKTFIEFGVEDYSQANTRFLMLNNNWSGLIMDGSASYMEKVRGEDIYWQHDIKAVAEFITTENVNSLFLKNGFEGELGLLHIDIDGNDYWVWKAITVVSPAIVIVEYNSVFGSESKWTIPYKADFNRTEAHYSNLYFGASLGALCELAEEKGYNFIGSNNNGNNAYFVRKDKIKELKATDSQTGYVMSQFRESRDKEGNLTYVTGKDRLKLLSGLEVYNTRTKKIEKI